MDGIAMCASIIVRAKETGRIVRIVDVTLDETTVLRVLDDLSSEYGSAYVFDVSQVQAARAAAMEAA